MHNENWDDLRFLIAVIDEGSLNGAAKRLRVNHATVLRRITAFEDRIGIKLFERHKSGYRIQGKLEDLTPVLQNLRDAIEATNRAVMGQGQEPSGKVKITSTVSLCEYLLPPILASLQALHSGLQIDLLASNTRLNLSQMVAEIAVRPAHDLPDDLQGICVGRLPFSIYGQADLVARSNGRLDASTKWLMPSDVLQNAPVLQWMLENTRPEQRVMQADNFVSLRSLARTGVGLAILPDCIVQPSDGLVVPEQGKATLFMPLWVATHKDLWSLPRIRACRTHLVEQLKAADGIVQGY